jgi:4-hydroxy-3-methylbut-2-enyl diphosphate reductase
MLKIKLAKGIGFCSGVKRAINIVEKILTRHKGKVYSYGSIIHNPLVIRRLEKKNLFTVSSLDDVEDSSVVILPSHGSPRFIKNLAKKKKIKLIDVICPYVSSVHKICASLYRKKLKVVIVGDRTHPEVKALVDLAPNARIIGNTNEIKENEFSYKKIGIISQTTQAKAEFFKIVAKILKKNHNLSQVHIFNTICLDTSNRQEEVKRLAEVVDTLLVIGSGTSANTKRLLQLGRKVNKKTFLVEHDNVVLDKILKNARDIGIISGASAPQWLVKAIVKKIREATLDT